MTSFLAFFGLSCNPFAKSAPVKDCFKSRDFNEMYGALDYVKDARGIAVFTSPPGGGKSFVIRAFADTLNPNLYRLSYICLSTVSIAEFYKQLCDVLGGWPPKAESRVCSKPSRNRSSIFIKRNGSP